MARRARFRRRPPLRRPRRTRGARPQPNRTPAEADRSGRGAPATPGRCADRRLGAGRMAGGGDRRHRGPPPGGAVRRGDPLGDRRGRGQGRGRARGLLPRRRSRAVSRELERVARPPHGVVADAHPAHRRVPRRARDRGDAPRDRRRRRGRARRAGGARGGARTAWPRRVVGDPARARGCPAGGHRGARAARYGVRGHRRGALHPRRPDRELHRHRPDQRGRALRAAHRVDHHHRRHRARCDPHLVRVAVVPRHLALPPCGALRRGRRGPWRTHPRRTDATTLGYPRHRRQRPAPSGRARFGETVFDAQSTGAYIARGSAIEVVGRMGQTIVVEESSHDAAREPSGAAGGMPA